MRVPQTVLLLAAAFALSPPPGASPAPQQPPAAKGQETPTFAVSTAAVTLDVVVRDKKGNVVRDLKESDFGVFENGVVQRIQSFEVFGRDAATTAESAPPRPAAEAPATTAPAAAPAPRPVTVRPQVIAFVFDRLSPEARNTAQKAALTYIDRGHVEGDIVGVFAVDLALRTIQPFTSDPSLIRAGLERAASQANTAFANNAAAIRDQVEAASQAGSAAESTTGANPGQGGAAAASELAASASSAAVAQMMANMQVNMLRSFESLERDQQGFASTNGLLAVVSGLRKLPGRKTVVFFSEGLSLTPNVLHQFDSVIHTANRANVSVYTMDAAGLRVLSMNDETRKELMQAGNERIRQLEAGNNGATNGPMTGFLERNEDRLRGTEAGLGRLANQTGGFMIRDTNDAASAFRRIEEDMRFHYLLGYTPSNENYDGSFRTITVKVSRPGVTVQSRQGYFALRGIESAPVRSYEAPAIAQLDSKAPPHDFPVQLAALTFPTREKPGLAPVLVRIPGSAVTYLPDISDTSPQKIHRADLAVVVRVRDAAGREVDRLSQNYPLSASAQNLDAAHRGDVLFYREADLPPGRYTLEAVGYDAASRKASVASAPLEVRAANGDRPRLSSVVLVGRVEKVAASDRPAGNPLVYGDTILYPNMGEAFRKATSPALGFFFTVYAGRPGGAPSGPCRAVLEVVRDGQPAGQVATDLPAPDAAGRIQYAGSLPLQGFAAGAYQLKVTATTPAGSDTRETAFTVSE
jgi:VWFA-related protein